MSRPHRAGSPESTVTMTISRVEAVSRRALLAGLTGLLLVCADAVWLYRSLEQLVAAQTPVTHTMELQRLLGQLTEQLLQAEAGQRGYLLTGKADYLRPYHAAVDGVDGTQASLRDQLAGRPEQLARLRRLGELVTRRLTELDQTVLLRAEGGVREAMSMVQTDIGKQEMDQITALIATMRTTENSRLNERATRQVQAVRSAEWTFGIATLMNLLLLGLIYSVVRRALRQQAHAEIELKERNEALSTALEASDWHGCHVAVLSELGRLLQASASLDEAIALLKHYLPRLFGAESGALYLLDASLSHLGLACNWGGPQPSRMFPPGDCWALRRGQPYAYAGGPDALCCNHLDAQTTPPGSTCLPLNAQGEMIGLLHLAPSQHGQEEARFQQFVLMALEQIALSIANLRLRDTLRQQSIRDPLTGLFNRRYLEEALRRELIVAARRREDGEPASVAVVMLDIDHFKRFNDTHGHDAGDAVLREVAQALKRHARQSDFVSRYGGEEFTLVLPNTTLAIATQRIERIRESVASLELSYHGKELGGVTISLGLAVFPEHGELPDQLLQLADAALYEAKHAGRNRHAVAGAPEGG